MLGILEWAVPCMLLCSLFLQLFLLAVLFYGLAMALGN